MTKTAVFAALLLAASTANADLSKAERTGTFGQWEVLRDIDKMTDKVECVGVYKTDHKIQLAEDGMYFAITGGIETVTLRHGNDPAQPMRLARKIEKDVRAVMLEGEEFRRAVFSDRLRMQVLTMVSGVQTFDIDTSGVADAVEHIKAGCPNTSKTPAQSTANNGAGGQAKTAAPMCSPTLLARMKAQGIDAGKIQAICAPG